MQVCTQNCSGCSKNKHRNDEDKKNLIKRLNRVEGQVRGISKMVEEDRYCEDVLIQISAIINSLRSMSNELLKSHLATCVVDEIKKDNLEVIDEVVNLFNKIK
ncbi:MAG: metal-sensing transcriptional repressor [Candidatus Coprovivens sp.]